MIVLSMKGIATEVSKADHLVVHSCTGSFTTAKACIMLRKHWGLIGCEIDPIYFKGTAAAFRELVPRSVLNRKLGTMRSAEVVEIAQKHLKPIYRINAWNSMTLWDVPPRLAYANRSSPCFAVPVEQILKCDAALRK